MVGISEIDTRNLTVTLRNSGSLWGVISSDVISIEDALVEIEKHKKQANRIVNAVSSPTIYEMEVAETNSHRIILYDFGTKKSIINYIARLDCNVIVVPWNTNFETVLNMKPDGIILSNGPGDPNDCVEAIKSVNKFIQLGVPILGICLGHQILSLACDAKVYKMKYGHHGANHPIYNEVADKVSITSQNHNYAVDKTSLSNSLKVTHYSLFDGSIQGIKHKLKPAIGFQGHPEASPGPHDLIYVFQEFINMIDANKANQTFLQLRKNRYA